MSQYTLTLREIIESGVKIFDFDYPIFDEKYRSTLENNIIQAYYFREIGSETAGRFKYYLKAKMQLIMPNYNEFYKTTLYDIDPLSPYHITESYTRDTDQTGNITNTTDQTENGTTSSNKLFSDTPQGRITLQPDGSDNGTYITEINEDKVTDTNISNSTGSTDTTGTGSEKYSRTMTGHIGVQTYGDLIKSWRENLINVDQMIIEELRDLFMKVY